MPDQNYGPDFAYIPRSPSDRGIVSGSLHESWEAIKRDPVMLIGLTLLVSACWGLFFFIAPNILGHNFDLFTGEHSYRTNNDFGPLKFLAILIINVFRAGLAFTFLRAIRREAAPFDSIFSGFPRIIHLVIADVLVGICVFCGFIFLIIPAIFFAISFAMRSLLIIDRDADCITALQGSWQMMRGYRLDLFLLSAALFALNIVGLLALGLGLIITLPLSYGAIASFYNRVLQENPPKAT